MRKNYKFGIISTGTIAKKMAEAIRFVEGATLYAVASRSEKSAAEFARQFSIPKAYGSYEAMLADPEVEVVYVATPHHLHQRMTLLALEAGKHVLCEKPFAVNGQEARGMIEKAREKNLLLMEALWSRFLPHLIRAKDLINRGQLGKINLLNAYLNIHPPYNPDGRLFNRELIGGSLMDLGVYPVFLALYLMGRPEQITSVAAIGPTGVDHTCSISFNYPDTTMALLHCSLVSTPGAGAVVEGDLGTLTFNNWWHAPTGYTLKVVNGRSHERHLATQIGSKVLSLDISLHRGMQQYRCPSRLNGYEYEVEEVIRCLDAHKIESDLMSWQDSLMLMDTLDIIRHQCGIIYPGHDKK